MNATTRRVLAVVAIVLTVIGLALGGISFIGIAVLLLAALHIL